MIFTHRKSQNKDSSKTIYQKNNRRPKVSVKVLLNKARVETTQHSNLRGQPMLSMAASVSESLRSALDDFPSDVGREEYSIAPLAGDSDENKQSDIYILSREAIRRHKSKYDFLHIGLVQARVVPLHIRCIKVKIVVCLRDSKFLNFKESVLAAFEISLNDGVSNFNWFPNFSSSLSDIAKSNGLVITVEPQGYKLAERYEDSHVFANGNRMYYKLMKGALEPKSLYESPVLEVNTEKTKVLVPKPNSRN